MSMAKVEFMLARPVAADLIALFEQLKGRRATAKERRRIEADMARTEAEYERRRAANQGTRQHDRKAKKS
jgi:hypothetical protein